MPVSPRDAGVLAALLARIGRDASDLFAQAVAALGGELLSEAARARMIQDLDDLRVAAAETMASGAKGLGEMGLPWRRLGGDRFRPLDQ